MAEPERQAGHWRGRSSRLWGIFLLVRGRVDPGQALGMDSPLDKQSGKVGARAKRLIHLVDPVGSARAAGSFRR